MRAEDVRRVEPAAEPRLDDGDVDVALRELRERGRAERLELRRLLRLGLGPDAPDRRLEVDLLAVDVIRSAHERTCGETVAPTDSPSASRSASIVRVAVDLPFVPTTWIAGYASCGSPSAAQQRPHPPEPELLRPRAEGCEPGGVLSLRGHRARAGSGRASRARPRPPRASRSRRTSRSRASARRARPRRGGARSRAAAFPFTFARSGRTTASKIRFSSPVQLDDDAAAAEHRGRLLDGLERVGVGRVGLVRLGPGRDDQPRLVELRPDLLGHVRHHRVQEREQALERGERRRRRVLVALAQARLDRLRVPVAEVVEREPVERLHRVREVERRPRLLELAPASRRAAPGSSAPRPRADGPPARPGSGAAGARRSRACSRACGPPRAGPR